MATEKYLLETYKRFLLNRTTVTTTIAECIENCLTNEEETANQSFHKIMIHNWQDSLSQIFEVVSYYFGTAFIPVNCISQGELTSFYTSSLNLVLKLIKFDFMFPYSRNMFNVDVLFNDKTATDFFGRITTVEEIVSGVVCRRFNERCELDLSNLCEDPEFVNNKIWFHKISLLSQFKILMLRMGRDTKKLILRNNNLSQAPVDILNFFIKSDLTAIDFSYNNIPSLQELQRVSSKIEKLWIEGNPLCEELDPISYVKNVAIKFPRLIELDGVKFNQHGSIIPFFKNYFASPDKRTKVVVENFVANYFSNFDTVKGLKRIAQFYHGTPQLTMAAELTTAAQEQLLHHYGMNQRNMLHPVHYKKFCSSPTASAKFRTYTSPAQILFMFNKWPQTVHDLSTFTVDVLCHNKSVLMLVVDGIYKELVCKENPTENIFQFRRTFIFDIYTKDNMSTYKIKHEMINVRLATNEQIRNSFKTSLVNINTSTPIDPTNDEKEAIFKMFQHITQLKKSEAELILNNHDWNIFSAIFEVKSKLKTKNLTIDKFVFRQEDDDDDLSDISSVLDEVD